MTDHYHHTRSNPCWKKKKPPKRQEILVKLTLVHQPARCGWTRNIWRVRDGSERWITIPQEHVDQWDVIYLVGPARYPCQRATVSLDFMMLSTTLKMDCYCSGYWVTMIIFVSHLCDNITYQKNLLTPTQMRSSQDSTKVVINETMSWYSSQVSNNLSVLRNRITAQCSWWTLGCSSRSLSFRWTDVFLAQLCNKKGHISATHWSVSV